MPIWLIALTLGGLAMQTYGSYQSAKAQQQAYDYNAQLGKQQAADALMRGKEEENRLRAQSAQRMSQQKAALAANGVDLSSGSPLDILAGTDILTQQDAATIRRNAEREAWGYKSGTKLNRYYSDSISPLTQSASTFLGGAGNVASQWYTMSNLGGTPTTSGFTGRSIHSGF